MLPESIDPNVAIFLATCVLAIMLLSQLMRRRQSYLMDLLQKYVKSQLQWARKKARAAQLAREAALKKSRQDSATAKLYEEEEGFEPKPPASNPQSKKTQQTTST